MTTETEAGPPLDSEIWRAIGRLEGQSAALLEGQRELRAALDTGLSEVNVGLREANRRIDRLFYAILAVGGALLVGLFVSRFIG